MFHDAQKTTPKNLPSIQESKLQAMKRKLSEVKNLEKQPIRRGMTRSNQPTITSRTVTKLTKAERREKYTNRHREQVQRKRIQQKESKLICYLCRKTGHSVARCPQSAVSKRAPDVASENSQTNILAGGSKEDRQAICFKCGSNDHPLRQCPYRRSAEDWDLPFATCFVCNTRGHLARQCPRNEKGIYVNGGECKHCGSKVHLATHCPEAKKKRSSDIDADDDSVEKLLECDEQPKYSTEKTTPKKKKRVVIF